MFANDLEVDQQYKRWSTNLMELLRPAYPGQPREIARNLFTAVFILDPTSGGGMETLLSIRELITYNVPVRFGVLFHSGNPAASASGGSAKFDFTKEGVESSNSPTAESKEVRMPSPPTCNLRSSDPSSCFLVFFKKRIAHRPTEAHVCAGASACTFAMALPAMILPAHPTVV